LGAAQGIHDPNVVRRARFSKPKPPPSTGRLRNGTAAERIIDESLNQPFSSFVHGIIWAWAEFSPQDVDAPRRASSGRRTARQRRLRKGERPFRGKPSEPREIHFFSNFAKTSLRIRGRLTPFALTQRTRVERIIDESQIHACFCFVPDIRWCSTCSGTQDVETGRRGSQHSRRRIQCRH
jgi:hypothetical protein